jgi:hypothetical protein
MSGGAIPSQGRRIDLSTVRSVSRRLSNFPRCRSISFPPKSSVVIRGNVELAENLVLGNYVAKLGASFGKVVSE